LTGQDLVQFGCRENRNSVSHYQYCKENKVSLAPFEQLRCRKESLATSFGKYLNTLGKRVDSLGVTLDIDSCAEVIGSSAANTIGFSARELFDFARLAGVHPKTRYFEIAEVAPPLDISGKTSQVAAEILYAFLCGISQRPLQKRISVSNKNSNKTINNSENARK
jgi:arginase family enzyme